MDIWQLLTEGMSKEQVRAATVFSWRVFMLFQSLWLLGFLTPLGLPQPFAKAPTVLQIQTDMQTIFAQLKEDRVDRLEIDIFTARRQQCEALKMGTEEQKRQYGDRLNDLISKYKKLTQMYPRIPGCDEV